MRIKQVSLTRFDGGISDDVREQIDGVFQISKQFDITTNPSTMTPYRAVEEDNTITGTSSLMTAFKVRNFVYADDKLFGLGFVSSGSQVPRLLEKSASDVPSGNWALSASGTASTGLVQYNTLVEYKNYLYGFKANNTIWRYGDISGTRAFDGSWNTTSGTFTSNNNANGFHGVDDNLYLPYENIIAKWDNTTFTANRLSVPSDRIITNLINWKKFLAIGTKPKDISNNSTVYLWDFVSDDVSDSVDFGEGDLQVLGNIDEFLVGVSSVGGGGSALTLEGKAVVRIWRGGEAVVVKEIPLVDSSGNKYQVSQVTRMKGNKLYFQLSGIGATDELSGVYSIARIKGTNRWSVTMDRKIQNTDTVVQINNFYFVGDYFFNSHSNSSSIVKMDNSATFTTATYESQKLNGDNTPHKDKEIIGIAFHFPPLVSGGTITYYYRVNEESAWTDLGVVSVTNQMSIELSKELDGSNMNTFKEVQFRALSTGGAEVGGFKMKFRELDSSI